MLDWPITEMICPQPLEERPLPSAAWVAAPPATIQRLPLMAARGRVLAAPAVAPAPMPAFDNAAMGGYGVRTVDLAGDPPHALALAGRVAAGNGWAEADRVPSGSALRILAGR